MPSCFKKSIIFPLHKKGDIHDATNYRGISFIDAIVKLYTNMLLNRLNCWMEFEQVLSENQAGFRKGFSTVDHIFTLQNIIAIKMEKKEKVYAFFVDFKTAFDGIPRQKLFYKLYNAGLSTKFVKNIQQMYMGTTSAVWDGKVLSDWFPTNAGVKQGCGFSPALFAIYINDLVDHIKGGISVDDVVINILLYADDIVLLAESPNQLQHMIKRLENYCNLWDFRINISKSKVMIFGGGGRRAAREQWELNGQNLDVVSEYKYLGVVFTPKLSMQIHLQERKKTAKYSINSTWSSLINNRDISIDTKLKAFDACSRSILCYGAQVWGYKEYEIVEKLQRYFLKKLLGLPENTPNYMLLIETGLCKIFVYTMKLHMNFVLRCLNLPDNRLSKILARKVIDRKIFWYVEWERWLEICNLPLDASNHRIMKLQIHNLLIHIQEYSLNNLKEVARQGVHHDLYNQLSYETPREYFSNERDMYSIRMIFRARGGLLHLNTGPWSGSESMLCSLCNLSEPEDLSHFIGVCPILKMYRMKFFGKLVLSKDEIIEFLNGKDWDSLQNYLKKAYAYRNFLVTEYNH